MRNNNKSKIPSFLLGLSFTPDVSSGSYQGLSCSKTGSPTGSQLPSVHSHSVGSSMGCWGTSAVAPGASSPHPFALILVSAGLFLSRIHSSPHAALHGVFLPLHELFSQLFVCLRGSALASGGSPWGWLDWFCQMWEKLGFSHTSHPCSLSAIKTLLNKPKTVNQNKNR